MTAPLAQAALIEADLRAKLKEAHALEDGDDALEDTLQGATDFLEIAAAAARRFVELVDRAEAIEKRIFAMQEKADKIMRHAHNLKGALSQAMQESGRRRIPADVLPEFSVTLSAGRPKVIGAGIESPEFLPDEYCHIKTTRTADKAKLLKALESGAEFEFAHLSNPQPVLTIRTK